MEFIDYLRGERMLLRSTLPKNEVEKRINSTSGSFLWPFSNGIKGGVWFGRLRLIYISCWFFRYNAAPILAGRLHDKIGGCEMEAWFRPPIFAYVFYALWYLFLSVMFLVALGVGLTGGEEAFALAFIPFLLLFTFVPAGMHSLFMLFSGDGLAEMLTFLNREADFFIVPN